MINKKNFFFHNLDSIKLIIEGPIYSITLGAVKEIKCFSYASLLDSLRISAAKIIASILLILRCKF